MSQENKSISEKMTKLGELVAWFEGEEFELEAALDKYKGNNAGDKRCQG